MNYSTFEPEDFALDAFFCRWVLNPDHETEKFWAEWLQSFPHKIQDVDYGRQLVLLAATDASISPSNSTVSRMWRNIEAEKNVPIARSISFGFWIKIAAVFVFALALAGGYHFKKVQESTYRTAYGESRRLVLPDGSLVILNANSSLRISDEWNGSGLREVWLEGEAFFNVSKLRKKGLPVKFIVHTFDLNVEVKGTQFNVNTRKNQTRVVLGEGVISLQLNGSQATKQPILMQSGDMVNFSKNAQKLLMQHLSDPAPVYSWKNSIWTLKDTSLDEITTLIQDTYGVEVKIETDSLRALKVSGKVPADNLDDLLSALESIFQLNINHTENTVTITK